MFYLLAGFGGVGDFHDYEIYMRGAPHKCGTVCGLAAGTEGNNLRPAILVNQLI